MIAIKKDHLRQFGRRILKSWFGIRPLRLPTLKFDCTKSSDGTVYYIAPDHDHPSGGTRTLYRHVDILNSAGLSARIVHERKGFSYTWFKHDTKIVCAEDLLISPADIVVIPEVYGSSICDMPAGVRQVIFNQGAYLTFAQDGILYSRTIKAYHTNESLIAVMVVSEDSREYLEYAFPETRIERIFQSIDTKLFYPPIASAGKKIAFMPRRNYGDIVQVVQLLQARGALRDWALLPIDGSSPEEAADLLRSAAIFITVNSQEGFGLPPVEAMACGCLVVGFPGHGGREYLQKDWSFPVEQGNVKSLACTVESLMRSFEEDPVVMQNIARRGTEFIRSVYTLERERMNVISLFSPLLRNI
jgi:glycosyltransferase involved in cell wall biosynthesis